MIALDADVLVAWAMQQVPTHSVVRKWMEFQIRKNRTRFALVPQVIAEFLHVTTDVKRFAQPVKMDSAIELCDQLCNAGDVVTIAPDPNVVGRTLELLQEFQLGRKRILDTMLVATLELKGIRQLATFNTKDFEVFPFIETQRPS